MTSNEWQAAKHKVLSWIEHEERCVTTQRIAQGMNLSRLEASQLLQEISQEHQDSKFRFTYCQQEESTEDCIPVTVFRLRQSTTAEDNLVALASSSAAESISTAHERDLLEWREMVQDGLFKELTEQDAAIEPAEAVASLKDVPAPRANKLTSIEETTTQGSSTFSSNRHKAFSGKAKQVTTAASFFANHKPRNGSTQANKPSESASNSKVTAATSDGSDSNYSNCSNASPHSSALKPPQPTLAKENKVRSNQVAPAEKEVSKRSSNKKYKSFGNADDFVADEEESDDEEEVKTRKNKVARRKTVQEANRLSEEDVVDLNPANDDDTDKTKIVGAMDAFATEAPKKPDAPSNNDSTKRQRKRRKKLVEETVMVNGYLRSETKAIWEDVPSDEEEEEKEQERQRLAKSSSTKSQAPKTQQGMKQKSLMGFFSKK